MLVLVVNISGLNILQSRYTTVYYSSYFWYIPIYIYGGKSTCKVGLVIPAIEQ